MGMAYICINVIYDFAEVLTKILTCGKCKVGENFPPLSNNNHNRHRRLHHQSPGRTIVAQLSLLLCLVSSINSCGHNFDNLFVMAIVASVTVSLNSA